MLRALVFAALLALTAAFVTTGSSLALTAQRASVARTGVVVSMSAHAQLKGAKKKNRRRPKKRRPSDINRKAPAYDVVPGLADKPAEWTLVSGPPANFDADAYLAQVKAEVEAVAGHSYCTPLNPREIPMPSETPADVYHPLTVPQSV